VPARQNTSCIKAETTLVYDDLSKHAQTYRQMSLLRRPPGQGLSSDVFYLLTTAGTSSEVEF